MAVPEVRSLEPHSDKLHVSSPLISGLRIGPLSVIKTFFLNGTWQERQV